MMPKSKVSGPQVGLMPAYQSTSISASLTDGVEVEAEAQTPA